jgi:hypothetical protein
MLSVDPGQEIRAAYLRLRQTQRALNKVLFRMVSKKGHEECARALGFWQNGTMVFDGDEDVQLFMDFAIYEYRAGGENAVERFIRRGGVEKRTSDEGVVLEAMLQARFTLVEIEEIVPLVGARANDRLNDESFLLADVSLSETGAPGIVLSTRLLSFSTFSMTSGAPLNFDDELATLFVESLGQAFGRSTNARSLPETARKPLAVALARLALQDPEEMKAIWRDKIARRAFTP